MEPFKYCRRRSVESHLLKAGAFKSHLLTKAKVRKRCKRSRKNSGASNDAYERERYHFHVDP